ncbi:hypothetical protein NEIG_01801 [Nematocida sp. ERTm5]|nr:hypothetical protein NEIG_01801 [Nematocida sp. ERTm5]
MSHSAYQIQAGQNGTVTQTCTIDIKKEAVLHIHSAVPAQKDSAIKEHVKLLETVTNATETNQVIIASTKQVLQKEKENPSWGAYLLALTLLLMISLLIAVAEETIPFSKLELFRIFN